MQLGVPGVNSVKEIQGSSVGCLRAPGMEAGGAVISAGFLRFACLCRWGLGGKMY